MVKRVKEKISRQIDKLNENENISRLLSKRLSNPDDLIISLSDAYENQRARQVVEWEKIRRQNAQPAI